MSFRVLIAGPRSFADYPRLRDVLDALLANRLPDVELLTGGGPGVAMLAASYAAARGLEVQVVRERAACRLGVGGASRIEGRASTPS